MVAQIYFLYVYYRNFLEIYLLFLVSNLLSFSFVSCLLSLVSCLLSLVSCLLSLVSCLLSLFLVSCLLSLVSYILSLVSYLLSLVSYILSLVSCLLYLVSRPPSQVLPSPLLNLPIVSSPLSPWNNTGGGG